MSKDSPYLVLSTEDAHIFLEGIATAMKIPTEDLAKTLSEYYQQTEDQLSKEGAEAFIQALINKN